MRSFNHAGDGTRSGLTPLLQVERDRCDRYAPGMTVMTANELRRYADAIVRTCLQTRTGDVVAIHGETGHRPLVLAITEAAYQAGARFVDVLYVDPVVRRARVAEVHDAASLSWQPKWHSDRMKELLALDAAIVSITGEAEPGLMVGLDPERAVLESSSRGPGREVYLKAVASGEARFCVVAYPQAAWAKSVYPTLTEDRALRKLAQDLLSFTRLAPADADDAWARHVDTLVARARQLSERGFTALELTAPGTDLRLGLAPKTRFLAAEMQRSDGRRFCANLPTEEVFASPDAARTEGHFACTRPLSLEGNVIEGIKAEFSGGRLTRVQAKRPAHRDVLASYFARDRDAGRLGEVALVDSASRIGQTGRVYGMTLLDENAVAHVAFGSGFEQSRVPDAALKGPRGVNRSQIHVDVMIGCDELEVVGVTAQGQRVPVLEAGTWVLS